MPSVADLKNIDSNTFTAEYDITARAPFESTPNCPFPPITIDTTSPSLNSLVDMLADLEIKYPKILFNTPIAAGGAGGGGGGGGGASCEDILTCFDCTTNMSVGGISAYAFYAPCGDFGSATMTLNGDLLTFEVGSDVSILNEQELLFSNSTENINIRLSDLAGTEPSNKVAQFRRIDMCVNGNPGYAYILCTEPEEDT